MTARDTTSGKRAVNREAINSLLENRHARKDMLNGLFREHFSTPATIRCELSDHVVHLNPHDSTITPAVLEKGHWNRHELERALDVLRSHCGLSSAGIFFDVGANIGTQTIYAVRSGAFTDVHAFEPEPENARLFRLNVLDNGLDDVVQLFTDAVAEHEGTAELHCHPRNAGAHSLLDITHREGAQHMNVSVVTLDGHLERTGVPAEQVGLVWIDVEGAEPGVLAGASSLMTAGVPMVFEFLERDRKRPEFVDMFERLQASYSHLCRLQDASLAITDTSSLSLDMPEGDYLVFSKHD